MMSSASRLPKVNLLGINITKIEELELLEIISETIFKRKKISIFTPNVDFVVKAFKNLNLFKVFNSSTINICDGMPLVWGLKFLSKIKIKKISGSSLFFNLCDLARLKGFSIFLLGAESEVAQKAIFNLKKKYNGLNIVGSYSPPYGFEKDSIENKKIVDLINEKQPNIVFVGLGMPKQECWIRDYFAILKCNVILGIGGSIDFAAGTQSMPPSIFKKIGLAWFWRLVFDPIRMGNRYFKDLIYFKFLIQEKLKYLGGK